MPLEELLARHCLVLADQLKAAKKALEWYAVNAVPGGRARAALAEIKKLGKEPDDS